MFTQNGYGKQKKEKRTGRVIFNQSFQLKKELTYLP